MDFKRKISIFFFLFTPLFLAHPVFSAVDVEMWQTQKSQHFIVYFQEAPYGYVNNLINQAERYYNGILNNLGYQRFDFWSWDNRAKIYLFKDAAAYHADTERFSWSGAVVDVAKRTIKTFVGQEGFFSSMLPHEMAHIIFREFVGADTALPLWLDEGVACSQEESMLKARLFAAKDLVKQGSYIGLEQLSQIRGVSSQTAQVFYSQSASLVVFLLNKYGKNSFLDFSRRVRDGKDWQEALKYIYRFSGLSDMQDKWEEFIMGLN